MYTDRGSLYKFFIGYNKQLNFITITALGSTTPKR